MQQTQYYSFLKPEATDDVTPDPFNTNADAIDLALHNLSEDKQRFNGCPVPRPAVGFPAGSCHGLFS